MEAFSKTRFSSHFNDVYQAAHLKFGHLQSRSSFLDRKMVKEHELHLQLKLFTYNARVGI